MLDAIVAWQANGNTFILFDTLNCCEYLQHALCALDFHVNVFTKMLHVIARRKKNWKEKLSEFCRSGNITFLFSESKNNFTVECFVCYAAVEQDAAVM